MNHLQTEKSPYLEQHIDNPVDWYPWCKEAFARALDENKLIFLSIGYSTCHWCHVMAHECFEDEEVAALLNRNYISIKVDREERPDIDQVYMDVCQRMTGSGGWPLTIIMTPDARPFYAATYVPKHGQHGRPGLMNLLPWVTDKWGEDPDLLNNAASELVKELLRVKPASASDAASTALHDEAVRLLKESYDSRFGGFGNAPKFPRPHDLTFLLHRYRTSQDEECQSMALQTLQAMSRSGLYDQLGFGFHRYSTDKRWLVPHFEKMLYDQAGLILVYLEAWLLAGDVGSAGTARETLAYLSRDMISEEGAFFSAEDADSEGVEGKFYLWTKDEIDGLLGEEAKAFCVTYQVERPGNYHDEMTGELTGKNILHLPLSNPGQGLEPMSHPLFESSRRLLFEAREKRIRPHLDDKILTAWNGMAISAFARAGRVFPDLEYVKIARRAADFLLARMRDEGGRLMRRYRDGESAISGFSEDYAFLARGLLDLYSAQFDLLYLQQAVELARHLRTLFQDPDSGKLYDTPADGERLLIRPSSTFDGAMPSASAVSLEVFARLFLMTGDTSWKSAADLLLASMASEISRYPAGYTQSLQSASWLLEPTREIVIVGTLGDSATDLMLKAVSSSNLQQTVVLFKPANECEVLKNLAPYINEMTVRNNCATAYVCQAFACREPINDVGILRQQLRCLPK